MARPDRASRQQAERRGRRAEWLACLWLMIRGYRILDRRVRLPVGEIDIVARRGSCLAFVEVKQRRNEHLAKIAVTDINWRRISSAAALWAGRRSAHGDLDWRYDLIAIVPNRLPKHYEDFWRP